jgi:hypothetical protein
MAQIKKTYHSKHWWDVEDLEFWYPVGINVRLPNHFEKNSILSLKVKKICLLFVAIPLQVFTEQEKKIICPYKDLCMNLHVSLIRITPKWKEFKCSSSCECITKLRYIQIVEYHSVIKKSTLLIHQPGRISKPL